MGVQRGDRFWWALMGGIVLAGSLAVFAYNVISTLRPGSADPTDAWQVASGDSIYEARCAACHGRNLEGQPNWQSRLPTGEYPAPPHDKSGHTWHHPDEILFRITKLGGQAEAPPGFKSNMPRFSGALSDAEIWAVLAYIKSRWPEPIRSRQAEIDRRNRSR
jgi:mono/diheme cytochrome c family protein